MGTCSTSPAGPADTASPPRLEGGAPTSSAAKQAREKHEKVVRCRRAVDCSDGVAPSEMSPKMYPEGVVPEKQTFKEWYWYCTAFQSQAAWRDLREEEKARVLKRLGNNTTLLNARLLKNGRVRATVNDVSFAVNAAEQHCVEDVRCYEERCHSAAWRRGVKRYLLAQGIDFQFDWEPSTLAQETAHKDMGLFENGFGFSFALATPQKLTEMYSGGGRAHKRGLAYAHSSSFYTTDVSTTFVTTGRSISHSSATPSPPGSPHSPSRTATSFSAPQSQAKETHPGLE